MVAFRRFTVRFGAPTRLSSQVSLIAALRDYSDIVGSLQERISRDVLRADGLNRSKHRCTTIDLDAMSAAIRYENQTVGTGLHR